MTSPQPASPRPASPRAASSHWSTWRHRLATEAGEGVISTGIVVLIMALIGAAMWVAFSNTAETATDRVDSEVQNIGSSDDG